MKVVPNHCGTVLELSPQYPGPTSAGLSSGLFSRLWGYRVLVAEWIHFTVNGIISPTIKRKVYTFWGL